MSENSRGVLDINVKIQVETEVTKNGRILVYAADGQQLFGAAIASDVEAGLMRMVEKCLEGNPDGSLAPVKMVIV